VLASGERFPERHLLILTAFIFIAATLVLQGLTLAPLIRWLKVGPDKTQGDEEIEARTAMAHAALAQINRLAAESIYSEQYVAFLRYIYGTRLDALQPMAKGQGAPDSLFGMTTLRVAALAAERTQLIRLWRDNRVGDDVMHRLEAELDLEQTRMQKMSEVASGQ
jgi:CPA1 family monovalent cation:H+ antiporter